MGINNYTKEDKLAIDNIKKWAENVGFSDAALARLSSINTSTFNQIINLKYPTTPTKFLRQVSQAIENYEASRKIGKVPFVSTSVYKTIANACILARRNKNFSLVAAFVGLGKTFSIKKYVHETANTYLIEVNPMMSVGSFVKTLEKNITGLATKGNNYDRLEFLISKLKNTDSLIVVDEAEFLTPKALHVLRRIRDIANIGIVLAGTENLTTLIQPNHGQFDQIRSRVGFWTPTIEALSQDDCEALVTAGLGIVSDTVKEKIYQLAKGSARVIAEGLIPNLKQFVKGQTLDVALVKAVAEQTLTLR